MRVLLIAMPWHSLNMPSLSLGILKAAAHEAVPDIIVDDRYVCLEWVERMMRSGIPAATYESLANTMFQGVGEWIFSAALHRVPEWNLDQFRTVSSNFARQDPGLVVDLHRDAPAFVDEVADRIVAEGWDVVGLTSTFMQNVPSLALARALKLRRPDIITVMGGGNLDGPQGIAVHRTFAFIDYVVRGEGEVAFPALLRAIQTNQGFDAIPAVCWRRDGQTCVNPDGPLVPMDRIPCPDYDGYFTQLDASIVGLVAQPKLVLEAARGCWWGEKHHCKVCGLNGSGMKFRSKDPVRVWLDIDYLVRRHQRLDIVMVDNILDHRYFDSLLPMMSQADWDLRVHYEIKANLKPEQMGMLRKARVTHIQPGIESLSTHVLQLMDKGVSGPQNILAIREGENEGLTISWNHLYGFPGETDDDYESVIAQIPALVHLQPPIGAQRIAIERFSPYFNEPELGFVDKRPAAFYPVVYGMEPEQLGDLVFLFDASPHGISGETEQRLQSAIERWMSAHAESWLTLHQTERGWVFRDRRKGWIERDIEFVDQLECAAIGALQEQHGAVSLARELAASGFGATDMWAQAFLSRLKCDGLVYEQNEKYVLVATRFDPGLIRMPQAEAVA